MGASSPVPVRPAPLLLLVLLVPSVGAAPEVRIEGFTANLPGGELDDAVWIRNTSPAPVALRFLELEDGRGRIGFPPDAVLPPHATVVVAGNATAYRLATRSDPDFALVGLSAPMTMRSVRSEFALAQDGDVIRLWENASLLDAVRYGDAPSLVGWRGEAVPVGGNPLRIVMRTALQDHDDASDFAGPRERRLGQLPSPPKRFPLNGTVLPYAAPEGSRAGVEAAIALAERRLRINVYQFREIPLAEFLASRIQSAGLRVEVLLDERPVGESASELEERGHVIRTLEEAGAVVRLMQHDRYGYDHAKYIVIDDAAVLVQTENFVSSGIPSEGVDGNRGWGILVQSAGLASELGRVFDHDFALDEFGARQPGPQDRPSHPPPLFGAPGRHGSRLVPTRSNGTATLLVSPDGPLGAGDPVLAAIRGATRRLDVAQLNLPAAWTGPGEAVWPNPYLDALLEASGRGVEVRVLLDGHFLSDDEEDADNSDTAQLLRGSGIAARLVGGASGVLHVKGLVADRSTVVVGSMNWNRFSVVQNREVSLVVEDSTVGAFFADVFARDWDDAADRSTPAASWVATIITALLVAALRPTRGRR